MIGEPTRYYFTELLGDADRVGPIATSFNQSWRGGISRIVGHDAGFGPAVLIATAVTAVLAIFAWRAIGGATDRLGAILVVQLFGLLLSPISWTHHWVWLIPLMIWLLHGPLADRLGARILGWGWLVLTLIGVPWLLSFAQPTIWDIPARGTWPGRGWCTSSRRWRLLGGSPLADDRVDLAGHLDVLVGDAALGMRDQRERHCPPTDIDIGVMILLLGLPGDAPYRVDAVEECGEFDRAT